jgi:5-carboxymethyl-2-hydroxymuconate isomerase
MAIVTVTLLEGRNQEVKERVIKGITDVLTKELDPNPQHIRVRLAAVITVLVVKVFCNVEYGRYSNKFRQAGDRLKETISRCF